MSWFIDGKKVATEPVEFDDIQVGDEVALLFVPDDEQADFKIWVGVAERLCPVFHRWETSSRKFTKANDFTNEPFLPFTVEVSDSSDIVLVGTAAVGGGKNFVYRVVSDEVSAD